MSALFLGQSINNIVVVAPAELFAAPITPSPVAASNPSPASEIPTPSPLVQIILNVQNNEVVDTVHPSPIIERPTPEPIWNPIDLIAALPVEALEPSPAVAIGPMV
ncbi:unnamed protein product [Diatraea saccharalis]|nr:unnamed protein product [Diatraea saccharalis]